MHDVGLAEQAGDQVEVGVHHVQRQGVQAKVVARPEQRGAALDLQHLQGAVALIDDRLAQVLIGGAEPGEHVHERLPAGGLLGGDDAVCLVEGGGQGSSISTCLPACMARMATSACSRVGRQMSTRSTEPSAITASRSVLVANPNSPPILASFCGVRPKTITSSTSGR